MKKIVVSIPNTLLAGGVVMYLKKNPDFKVYRAMDQALGLFSSVVATPGHGGL
ncbi:MAG: hypothetical protein PHP87_08835 [Syntrophomonas sp.]|uniref:hypothetical protein n=1 Tax=Syntrophomonas sp. TaxID=2053627 RepID=UPI00263291C1|nr:hypothetical protein [Syntrophomonas sp.]MDD4627172.1 hypothetical protein [Syntrophomonas sp.]